jgi:putative DNA primase/helicase
MNGSIATVKAYVTPERYYGSHLNGSWGKATGDGWHHWIGLCPFHNDKRPGSFVVNRGSGAFKCFSCGENGGDIIDFHMKSRDLGFKDAFKQLQEVSQ